MVTAAFGAGRIGYRQGLSVSLFVGCGATHRTDISGPGYYVCATVGKAGAKRELNFGDDDDESDDERDGEFWRSTSKEA